MKGKIALKELKEFLFDYGKQIITWIGICSAAQQVLTNFMFDFVKHIIKDVSQTKITSVFYVICFIGIVIITIRKIYDTFKSEFVIKVKGDKEQKLIIKLGDYAENMDDVLRMASNEKKEAMFVIGINDEASMDIAEKRGVHRAVMERFYTDEEEISKLQLRTNEAFNKVSSETLGFGEIGVVEHLDDSKIMFVVNSRFEEEKSTSILGPQPKDIIKSVFSVLEKQSAEIVQIPILSSRNVKSIENKKIIFSVTIAEIVDEYFKELLHTGNKDYDLVLSIRKEDLEENCISARDIVKFIKDLKPMYHIK
ncbi:MAG: hypothetical protein ACRC7N_11965 [Clostridium sp.]